MLSLGSGDRFWGHDAHPRGVGLDRFCLWNQGPSVNGRGRRGFVQLLHGDEDV